MGSDAFPWSEQRPNSAWHNCLQTLALVSYQKWTCLMSWIRWHVCSTIAHRGRFVIVMCCQSLLHFSKTMLVVTTNLWVWMKSPWSYFGSWKTRQCCRMPSYVLAHGATISVDWFWLLPVGWVWDRDCEASHAELGNVHCVDWRLPIDGQSLGVVCSSWLYSANKDWKATSAFPLSHCIDTQLQQYFKADLASTCQLCQDRRSRLSFPFCMKAQAPTSSRHRWTQLQP